MPAEYMRKEREHELTLIVDRARDGDERAWNEIVRRFTPLVIAMTASCSGNTMQY